MDENWEKILRSIAKREGNTYIQSLLNAGLDVNALNQYRETMLSYAAEYDNLEMTEFLVQEGADGNVRNGNGSIPLHIAAQYGSIDIVKFFVTKGIFVNSSDCCKRTPLHYIAKKYIPLDAMERYKKIVRFLVDNFSDLNAVDFNGCTPLILAAQNKYRHNNVELFIELGANVECQDEDKWTMLHHSSQNGWLEIVQHLVKGGFDVDLNAKTSKGDTPLIIAAKASQEDVVDLLLESGASVDCHGYEDETALHCACEEGCLYIVKSLVSKGCSLNAKDCRGGTPLLRAASLEHINVVEYLIESGADVKCCDEDGWTVLHCACREGWLHIVKSLVSQGCDLDAEAYSRDTPLLQAAGSLKISVVEYLVESGADVEYPDDDGRSLLHYSCIKGWLDIVKSLIEKGIDLNAQDEYGKTPLHLAVRGQHFQVVKRLLEAGVDCNVKCIYGTTAFTYSIQGPPFLDGIILCIENGAYFQVIDYLEVSEKPWLKESILQDTQLCTQAIMNKFNNADLLKIYEMPVVAERLPSIEKIKITSHTNVAQDIAKCVGHEIQSKGFCNVLNVCPIVLSILCVKSLVEHYSI